MVCVERDRSFAICQKAPLMRGLAVLTALPPVRSPLPNVASRFLGRDLSLSFPFGVGFENQLFELPLRRRVDDRSQERYATPHAADDLLSSLERAVPATAAAPLLPDGESNQLQALER